MRISKDTINSTQLTLFALVTLSLWSVGCQTAAEANRVDPLQARSTLEAVLTSWQQGDSIDSWVSKQPQVVVQDLDWKAGYKLKAFEILEQGEAVDANLFCKVKLTLDDTSSKQSIQTVTYIVGTSPVRTVFRSLAP